MRGRGLRILGGTARGRPLEVPAGIRPTSGRVREAIFSMLGPSVEGASVLDLFAGCGALGLEALSRGAARVTMVEAAPPVAAALSRNVQTLGLGGDVVCADACCWQASGPYAVVLMDPPYRQNLLAPTLQQLCGDGGVEDGSRLVLIHEVGLELSHSGLQVDRTKRYGDSAVTVLMRQEKEP